MAVLGCLAASGCGALLPAATPQPLIYSLDVALHEPLTATNPPPPSDRAPTLVVSPTRAAAGFDSANLIYVREPHQLEHFAHSAWVDTPARMLSPIIVAAIARSGTFRAVGPAASGVAGDMRLDTEVLRLQQEFGGGASRVRFTLRAYLIDSATRRVMVMRDFDETITAASDDPSGGVEAAHRAVQAVTTRLALFCTEAAQSWTPLN